MKKKKDKKKSPIRFVKTKFFLVLISSFLIISITYLTLYNTLPSTNTINTISKILIIAGVLSFFAIAFITGILLLYKYYIEKPVEDPVDATEKVASGDFSVRVQAKIRKGRKNDLYAQLFDNFNLMAEELANNEMMKKDFIYNVSHELKTPISVIQNFSTILQSDVLTDSERKEYATKIGDATKRLSTLVMDILGLSRIENQKIIVNKSTFNLSEQLCRCIINFESIWEEKNIEINTEFDQNIELFSDENLLDIVWNNLLSNALKFTEIGGKVKISALKQDDKAIIKVEDNGCGIKEEDIKHIFDKFYQVDVSHATSGAGLGLTLVENIINLVGGNITVESKLGKGTCFIITLPLKETNNI